MTDSKKQRDQLKRSSPRNILVCTILLNVAFCNGQWDGSLDPNFANDGVAITSLGPGFDLAFAIAIQDDEKIIATGLVGVSLNPFLNNFGIVRYTSDGTLDTGFGSNGVVITPIGTGDAQARAVAIQPNDGKIIVAGSARVGDTWDVAVVRYLPNGFLDNTFGSSGIVIRSVGTGDDLAFAMALQPDGKILLGGRSAIEGIDQMTILRFDSNGTIDESFGQNGQTILNLGSDLASAFSLIVQPDEKILVGGYAGYTFLSDFAVVRLLANGQLDTNFGNGGYTLAVTSGNDSAYGMALHSNGKIVQCGKTSFGAGEDIAIVRYSASGIIDSSFGDNGIVTFSSAFGDDVAWAVVIQPDERIIVTGSLSNSDHVVIRFDATGALDPTFGVDGVFFTNENSYAHAMVLHPSGYLLTAGGISFGSTIEFMLTKHMVSLSVGVSPALGSVFDPSVYPNPNNGRFTVAGYDGMEPLQVRLSNALGQEVAAFTLGLDSPYKNLEQFSSGTFVLQWTRGIHHGTQRIVVTQ